MYGENHIQLDTNKGLVTIDRKDDGRIVCRSSFRHNGQAYANWEMVPSSQAANGWRATRLRVERFYGNPAAERTHSLVYRHMVPAVAKWCQANA